MYKQDAEALVVLVLVLSDMLDMVHMLEEEVVKVVGVEVSQTLQKYEQNKCIDFRSIYFIESAVSLLLNISV